jgi:hypothetical protein
MTSGPKWLRSIKEKPAGKVVSDPNGNRWEWASPSAKPRDAGGGFDPYDNADKPHRR